MNNQDIESLKTVVQGLEYRNELDKKRFKRREDELLEAIKEKDLEIEQLKKKNQCIIEEEQRFTSNRSAAEKNLSEKCMLMAEELASLKVNYEAILSQKENLSKICDELSYKLMDADRERTVINNELLKYKTHVSKLENKIPFLKDNRDSNASSADTVNNSNGNTFLAEECILKKLNEFGDDLKYIKNQIENPDNLVRMIRELKNQGIEISQLTTNQSEVVRSEISTKDAETGSNVGSKGRKKTATRKNDRKILTEKNVDEEQSSSNQIQSAEIVADKQEPSNVTVKRKGRSKANKMENISEENAASISKVTTRRKRI